MLNQATLREMDMETIAITVQIPDVSFDETDVQYLVEHFSPDELGHEEHHASIRKTISAFYCEDDQFYWEAIQEVMRKAGELCR